MQIGFKQDNNAENSGHIMIINIIINIKSRAIINMSVYKYDSQGVISMRNSPIYFYSPTPAHHRLLLKRRIFQSTPSTSVNTSYSIRKIESLSPSTATTTGRKPRRPIFTFNTVYQPKKHRLYNQNRGSPPPKDWITPSVRLGNPQTSSNQQPAPQHHQPFAQIIQLLNNNNHSRQLLNNQFQTQSRSQTQSQSNIRMQPCLQIFLCRNCFEYYSAVEKKLHNKSCSFQGTRNNYMGKWRKLKYLLRVTNAPTLSTIAAEMENEDHPIYLDFHFYLSSYSGLLFDREDLGWLLQQLIVGMRQHNYSRASNMFSCLGFT